MKGRRHLGSSFLVRRPVVRLLAAPEKRRVGVALPRGPAARGEVARSFRAKRPVEELQIYRDQRVRLHYIFERLAMNISRAQGPSL